jgi:hypothetical protein
MDMFVWLENDEYIFVFIFIYEYISYVTSEIDTHNFRVWGNKGPIIYFAAGRSKY